MKRNFLILGIVLLTIPMFAFAAARKESPEPSRVWVGDYTIDTAKGEQLIPAELRQYPNKPRGEFLVQFRGAASKTSYSKLASQGEIIQYYPDNTYLVRMRQQNKDAVRSFSTVRWLGDFHPAYKIPQHLLDLRGEISLTVYFYDTAEAEDDIEFIRNLGGVIFERSIGSTSSGAKLKQVNFHHINPVDLIRIVNLPEVHVVEKWENAIPEDERGDQIVAGNYTSGVPNTGYQTWLTNMGLDGAGITVFDDDTGLDTGNTATLHQDLRGRVAFKVYNGTSAADSGSGMGHGTHTSGIIAGNGTLGTNDAGGFRLGMGVAPGANLYFANGLGGTNPGANTLAPDAITDPDGTGPITGAQVTSFSWTDGKGDGVKYNSEAAAWDARVRDASTTTAGNQQLAVVFSAGNSGSGASTLTSPKAAKNIITVGNSYNYRNTDTDGCTANPSNIDTMASSSSRGPTGDGRIKPDVSAPGTVIASLRSYSATYSCAAQGGSSCCSSAGFTGSTDYILMSGTSMACPHVAGTSAIIFQWWRNNHSGANPSPAMDKAILINGAVDMGTADIPNNNEGWGRVNLQNSIAPGVPVVYHDQDFSLTTTGQSKSYQFSVSNTSRRVRVTLVWTDPPGAVYTGTTAAPNQPSVLVNNLDLTVSNGTSTYKGNVFSGGQSTTGGTADSKNNVECVYLPASASGTWTVTIAATALNGKGDPTQATNNQDYALVIQDATETAGDTVAPTTSLTAPAAGSTLSGTATVSANASDNVGVTSVQFYAGATLIGTDTTSPYSISWNTTTVANGSYSLTSKAYDAAGNSGTSSPVSVTVSNAAGPPALAAAYDATLKAPKCGSGGKSCDTGASLIIGRGTMSPAEPNQPNTINGSCADGNSGTYHSDESLDQLSVATNDATALAGGKTVTVSATAWCWGTADSIDLYYTSNASSPGWTLIGTQACTAAGAKTFTATYTLPSTGTQHAIRGTFRYNGSASACGTNSNYDDHDDLVFGVNQTTDTTPPTTSITSPTAGSTVSGTITISANASDNVGVTQVEFYDGTTLIGADTTSPYSVSWNTTTVSNGSHSLTSKAFDAAGNTGTSAAVSVTVSNTTPDTTPPTTSITSPTAGSTVSGTITVSANAGDNVGVTKVEFYDGTTLIGTDTTSPYSVSWNTTTVSNGSHSLTSKAFDAANNTSTSSAVSVTVSNTTTCGTSSQLLANPGFESGASTGWTKYSSTGSTTGIITNSTSRTPRSGSWYTWLNGKGSSNTQYIYSSSTTMLIPSNACTATLSFWLKIDTAETTTTTAYDKLTPQIRSKTCSTCSWSSYTTLATYSNLNKSSSYEQKSFDLSSYKGKYVQIRFYGKEDVSLQTSFLVDDTAINVTQ